MVIAEDVLELGQSAAGAARPLTGQRRGDIARVAQAFGEDPDAMELVIPGRGGEAVGFASQAAKRLAYENGHDVDGRTLGARGVKRGRDDKLREAVEQRGAALAAQHFEEVRVRRSALVDQLAEYLVASGVVVRVER